LEGFLVVPFAIVDVSTYVWWISMATCLFVL